MLALKWLRLLMNHIPDKYEHLVRYYGYYSNRSRGARRRAEHDDKTPTSMLIDDSPADDRRKANWVRRSHHIGRHIVWFCQVTEGSQSGELAEI